jgi:hypothetical protein
MNTETFTKQSDWEKYWRNQEIIPYEKLFIEEFLDELPKHGKLIEIGGFPGKFAGYFKKKFNYDVTILDFIMIPEIVANVEKSYELPPGSIKKIKADFFEYISPYKYEIVTSIGFIEHFEDTRLVLSKHVELLKSGGGLLVTLPNFRGLNGFVQKIFDPKNYTIHNISSMDVKKLKEIMSGLELSNFSVTFYGKPTIWLEADAPLHPFLRKLLLLTEKVIKRIPFKNNRLLAPHIVITGMK